MTTTADYWDTVLALAQADPSQRLHADAAASRQALYDQWAVNNEVFQRTQAARQQAAQEQRHREQQAILESQLAEQAAQRGYGRDLGLLSAREGYAERGRLQGFGQERAMLGMDAKVRQQLAQLQHGQALEQQRLENQLQQQLNQQQHGLGLERIGAEAMYADRSSAAQRAWEDQQNLRNLESDFARMALEQRFQTAEGQRQHGNTMERDAALQAAAEARDAAGFRHDVNLQTLRGQQDLSRTEAQQRALREQAADEYRQNYMLQGLRGQQAADALRQEYGLRQGESVEQSVSGALSKLSDMVSNNPSALQAWKAKTMGVLNSPMLAGSPRRNAELQRLLAEFYTDIAPTLNPRKSFQDNIRENVFPLSELGGQFAGSTDLVVPKDVQIRSGNQMATGGAVSDATPAAFPTVEEAIQHISSTRGVTERAGRITPEQIRAAQQELWELRNPPSNTGPQPTSGVAPRAALTRPPPQGTPGGVPVEPPPTRANTLATVREGMARLQTQGIDPNRYLEALQFLGELRRQYATLDDVPPNLQEDLQQAVLVIQQAQGR